MEHAAQRPRVESLKPEPKPPWWWRAVFFVSLWLGIVAFLVIDGSLPSLLQLPTCVVAMRYFWRQVRTEQYVVATPREWALYLAGLAWAVAVVVSAQVGLIE